MANKQRNDPRRYATQLLLRLNFQTAPIPVDRVAKALEAQLRYSPLDQELSGMIFIRTGVPIIGVNSLHHPHRQRFTIAHELGHLEMHRELITESVHVDKQFNVLMRDTLASSGTDDVEIEANQFAAELLMPSFLLEPALAERQFDIDDDKPLEEVARRFKVSRQALEYQISNMGPSLKRR